MNKKIIWGIIIAVVMIAGGLYYWKNNIESKNTKGDSVAQLDLLTSDWKTYTDIKKDFSIKYPPNWKVEYESDPAFRYVVLMNINQIKNPATDRADFVQIYNVNTDCDTNTDGIWEKRENGWLYSRTDCLNGHEIIMNALTETSKLLEEKILSTFKFISIDNTSTINKTPQSTKPYITIFSPNGGEKLEIGSIMHIQWGWSYNPDPVNIYLLKTDKTQTITIAKAIQNSGSHYWTIPNNIKPGSYILKISITDKNGEDSPNNPKFGVSDNSFTIADDWKTYTNLKLGFEFKYPSDWIIHSNLNADITYPYSDQIVLVKPENNSSYISKSEISSEAADLTVNLCRIGNGDCSTSKYINNTEYSTIIKFQGGVNGYSMKTSSRYIGEYDYGVAVNYNDKTYLISFPAIHDGKEIDQINKQILSTFKFIPIIDKSSITN